jgi:hypothetical protein
MSETLTPEALVERIAHVDVKPGEFLVVYLDENFGSHGMRMFVHSVNNFVKKFKITAPIMFVNGDIRIVAVPKDEVLALETKSV